jgi:hypothetical protein
MPHSECIVSREHTCLIVPENESAACFTYASHCIQRDSPVMTNPADDHGPSTRQLARLVLVSFLLTFIAARVVVFLIMDRRLPNLFLHVGGTHVHHLNYGIFLLSVLGGYLLFVPRDGQARAAAAVIYGIGLALTFDEFGMWLHLGGGYWQRASLDAVLVISGLLALLAYIPPIAKWRLHHFWTAAIVVISAAVFFWLLSGTLRISESKVDSGLQRLEEQGPR